MKVRLASFQRYKENDYSEYTGGKKTKWIAWELNIG